MPTPSLDDQHGFEELVQQIALGSGFQLLVVITSSILAHGFAERLCAESAALREAPVEHVVLDPYIAIGPKDRASLELLDRWVLWPLLHAPLLRECSDPLVVVDVTSFHALSRDADAWRRFWNYVNRQRNALMRAFAGTLVLLVSEELAVTLAGVAPDLWSIRSGVVRIVNSGAFATTLEPPRGRLAEQLRLRRELWRSGVEAATLRAIEDDLYAGNEAILEATSSHELEQGEQDEQLPGSELEARLERLPDGAVEDLRKQLGAPRSLVRSARGDSRARAKGLTEWASRRGKGGQLREVVSERTRTRPLSTGRSSTRGQALLIGGGGPDQRPIVGTNLAAMRETLEESGFEVEVLARATRERVLELLHRLSERVGPDDAVVIYYSGHGGLASFGGQQRGHDDGERIWSYRGFESEPGHASQGPFSYIFDVELGHILGHVLAARCNNVTVIMDSSYFSVSGQRGSAVPASVLGVSPPRYLADTPAWDAVSPDSEAGVVVLAGAGEYQHAYASHEVRGFFTAALARVLHRSQGHTRTWGFVLDEVRRDLQLRSNVPVQSPRLVGPRGRVTFSRKTFDTSREFEVFVTHDGLRVSAGGLHGLTPSDQLTLLDQGGVPLGVGEVREVYPTHAWLDGGDLSMEPGTSLTCVLSRRSQSIPVRIGVGSPTLRELRTAVDWSPWLRATTTDDDDDPLAEVSIDAGRLILRAPTTAREPIPSDPREDIAGDFDGPVPKILEDLEQLAHARAFESQCRTLLAPPDGFDCWARAHDADGSRLLSPKADEMSLAEQLSLGVHLADSIVQSLFVTVVNVGIDGRMHVITNNQVGGMKVVHGSLLWPADVPRQPTREALWFVLTSEPTDLIASPERHPPSSRSPGDRSPSKRWAKSRKSLEALFDPSEAYAHCVEFIVHP